MDRCAVFVDAGWFLSESAQALTGRGSRGSVECDTAKLTEALGQLAEQVTRLPLLRIYWYDASADGVAGGDHLDIANLRDVKLRLGRISHKQQKGVDALLILDLTTLARERAIASALVLSGDEDIRDGVAQAQNLGVRVTIGGVAMPEGSPSIAATLVREADDQLLLDLGFLNRYVRVSTAEPAPVAAPGRQVAMAEDQLRWGIAGVRPAQVLVREPEPVGAVAAHPQLVPTRLVAADHKPADGAWSPRRFGHDFGAAYADRLTDDELRLLQREAPEVPSDAASQLFREAEEFFGDTRGRSDLRRELRAGFWDHVMQRRNG